MYTIYLSIHVCWANLQNLPLETWVSQYTEVAHVLEAEAKILTGEAWILQLISGIKGTLIETLGQNNLFVIHQVHTIIPNKTSFQGDYIPHSSLTPMQCLEAPVSFLLFCWWHLQLYLFPLEGNWCHFLYISAPIPQN